MTRKNMLQVRSSLEFCAFFSVNFIPFVFWCFACCALCFSWLAFDWFTFFALSLSSSFPCYQFVLLIVFLTSNLCSFVPLFAMPEHSNHLSSWHAHLVFLVCHLHESMRRRKIHWGQVDCCLWWRDGFVIVKCFFLLLCQLQALPWNFPFVFLVISSAFSLWAFLCFELPRSLAVILNLSLSRVPSSICFLQLLFLLLWHSHSKHFSIFSVLSTPALLLPLCLHIIKNRKVVLAVMVTKRNSNPHRHPPTTQLNRMPRQMKSRMNDMRENVVVVAMILVAGLIVLSHAAMAPVILQQQQPDKQRSVESALFTA